MNRRALHFIVFILDLSHDLLDDILERHQALGTPEFIDDDPHVDILRLEFTEQLADLLGLRYEDWRAENILQYNEIPVLQETQQVGHGRA